MISTFVATLVLPVAAAVGVGLVLSLLLQLNREALDLAVVERVHGPDGTIEERPVGKNLASDRVTELDVYGSLFYAGAQTLRAELPDPTGAERPVVVLRLRGRSSLGATFVTVVDEYANRLHQAGGRLYLSGVDPDMMTMLATDQPDQRHIARAGVPCHRHDRRGDDGRFGGGGHLADHPPRPLTADKRGDDPMQFDMPLEDLRRYRPSVDEPDDFDEYWAAALESAASRPLDVEVRSADGVISAIDVYDVRFTGHGGARIAAWLLVPAERRGGYPCRRRVRRLRRWPGPAGGVAAVVLCRVPPPRDGLAWPGRWLARRRHFGHRRDGRTGDPWLPHERAGGAGVALLHAAVRRRGTRPRRPRRAARSGRAAARLDRSQPGRRRCLGRRPPPWRRRRRRRGRAVPVQLSPGGGGHRQHSVRRDRRLLPALSGSRRQRVHDAVVSSTSSTTPAG